MDCYQSMLLTLYDVCFVLQSVVAGGWMTCLLLIVGCVFATYPTFTGHTFGVAGNVVYGCLRHVSWAAAVSWLLYCCCCQYYAGIELPTTFVYYVISILTLTLSFITHLRLLAE